MEEVEILDMDDPFMKESFTLGWKHVKVYEKSNPHE
jgi:hypothetical protein